MFIRLLSFIRGYVRFKASGGFPERFLNLCSGLNIPFWDVESRDGTLFASTTPSGYRRIRRPAGRSGMRVRIYRKKGLPFFIFHHRRRAGLLFGAAAFILILAALSGKIWTVTVDGCQTVPPQRVEEILAKTGVRPGVRRRSIDIESCEQAVLEELPELSWLAINFQGSAVTVQVREHSTRPSMQPDGTPSNIVASTDGQIVTMEVFSGTPEQKVSSAVTKGDLLISGVIQNRDGSSSFRTAQGYVEAVTNRTITTELETLSDCSKISRLTVRRTLVFFGLKIPLGRFNPGDRPSFSESRFLVLGNMKLPIGIITDRAYDFSAAPASSESAVLRLFALERHFASCADELRDKKVMNMETRLRENGGKTVITDSCKCLENIAEPKPLDIELSEQGN